MGIKKIVQRSVKMFVPNGKVILRRDNVNVKERTLGPLEGKLVTSLRADARRIVAARSKAIT